MDNPNPILNHDSRQDAIAAKNETRTVSFPSHWDVYGGNR